MLPKYFQVAGHGARHAHAWISDGGPGAVLEREEAVALYDELMALASQELQQQPGQPVQARRWCTCYDDPDEDGHNVSIRVHYSGQSEGVHIEKRAFEWSGSLFERLPPGVLPHTDVRLVLQDLSTELNGTTMYCESPYFVDQPFDVVVG